MSREWHFYLEDIRDSCRRVQEYTSGMSFQEFERNRLILDATVHNLEVIGEACKHIPEEVRVMMPDIAWSSAAKFRDYIAHHYFNLDVETVWDVLQNEIPLILHALEQFMDDSPSSFQSP